MCKWGVGVGGEAGKKVPALQALAEDGRWMGYGEVGRVRMKLVKARRVCSACSPLCPLPVPQRQPSGTSRPLPPPRPPPCHSPSRPPLCRLAHPLMPGSTVLPP